MLASQTLEDLLRETEEIGHLLHALKTRLSAVYVLLDTAMHEAHPPICPKCGAPMVIRTQKQNPEARFLGCTRYKGPKSGCKGSMSLNEWRQAAETALREQVL